MVVDANICSGSRRHLPAVVVHVVPYLIITRCPQQSYFSLTRSLPHRPAIRHLVLSQFYLPIFTACQIMQSTYSFFVFLFIYSFISHCVTRIIQRDVRNFLWTKKPDRTSNAKRNVSVISLAIIMLVIILPSISY